MSKFTLTRLTFNIQKHFFTTKPFHKSTSENAAAASSSSFTVDYLTNSFGFSLKSAISASKTVNLVEYNKQHYDSVVHFLKSNEFSETQVVKLVKKYPAVLSSRISTLQPKFHFFTENGVSSSLLPKIFVSNPDIMGRSVDSQLRPVMQFLRKYITSHDKFEVAILRGSWIFSCNVKNRLMPNVEFLIQQGVPKNRIGYILVVYPRRLFYHRLEKIASAIDRIRVMGVKPSDNKFIRSLCAVLGLSELSWKKKLEVFESMGWSYDEVVSMFVRQPNCLGLSEKKLRDTMDFLVNTVKYDPKIIIRYPNIFTYSLEKRIVPRYTVWKMLTDQGLIQKTGFVQLVISRSEKFFTESYIKRFSTEIPDLQSIYDQSKKLGRVYE